MTIYLTDDAFSVKAKRFDKTFISILALFFLLRHTTYDLLYSHIYLHDLKPLAGRILLGSGVIPARERES